MYKIERKLKEIDKRGEAFKLAIIGAGMMGSSLIAQIQTISAMEVGVVIEHTPQKGVEALVNSGIPPEKIVVTDDITEAAGANDEGKIVVSKNYKLSYKLLQIRAIVDCSGRPDFGALIGQKAIQYHKHIISLNVECDSAVGPILYNQAKKAGVVYTGIDGDEPGAIMQLVDFASGLGLEILVAGKGKNNPLDNYATPKTLEEKASSQGLSPRMLTSFVDGTNSMIELNSVCNCTGFKPDTFGCHGIKTDPSRAVEDFKLKEDGGVLNSYKIVEFSPGMAPGVFLIVTSSQKRIRDLMKYLGLGEGPNYLLYRPYHLTSLETPITIYNAVVEGEATIAPLNGQVADTVTVAKRDIKKGETLEGIGSEKVFGKLTTHEACLKEAWVPISLITEKAVARVDIKKDTIITGDLVDLDEGAEIVKLRRQQDRLGL